jgi:hypothetical protein
MTDVEEYNCDICNQTFTSENSKESHMSTQKHQTNIKFNDLTYVSNKINQKIESLDSKLDLSITSNQKIESTDLTTILNQNKEILKKIEELQTFENNKHKILQDYILKISQMEKSNSSILSLKTIAGYVIASIPIALSISYYFVKNIK